jgi:DNA-directed RNA polymerase subunit M
MKFCPKCGTLMLPKKEAEGAKYSCACGYSEIAGDTKITSATKEKIIEEVKTPSEDDVTLPTCEMTCEECGHTTCFFWDIQTRASDEPPTRFYRCVKCKYTWREYS